MGLGVDETLPRIHREFDKDDLTSAEGMLEIGKLPDSDLVCELHALHNSAMDDSLSLPGQKEYAPINIDLDFDSAQYPPSAIAANSVQSQSVNSLRSYSSLPHRPSNCPHLSSTRTLATWRKFQMASPKHRRCHPKAPPQTYQSTSLIRADSCDRWKFDTVTSWMLRTRMMIFECRILQYHWSLL
jgi:hypothetical protein